MMLICTQTYFCFIFHTLIYLHLSVFECGPASYFNYSQLSLCLFCHLLNNYSLFVGRIWNNNIFRKFDVILYTIIQCTEKYLTIMCRNKYIFFSLPNIIFWDYKVFSLILLFFALKTFLNVQFLARCPLRGSRVLVSEIWVLLFVWPFMYIVNLKNNGLRSKWTLWTL